MRKKILVLSFVLATLSTIFAGTTLAYFIDATSTTETFTVGNVGVTNTTTSTGTCTSMALGDTCTKTFTATNSGSVTEYARVRVLVPDSLLTATLTVVADPGFSQSASSVYCNGNSGDTCTEYVYTWSDALDAGNTTSASPALSFTYNLSSIATAIGEGGTGTNDTPAILGVIIYTEAIQAQGFANATSAFGSF